MRMVTDTMVIVSTHLQIKGQRLIGGAEIQLRGNHSLRVLHKQADERWLIVSEMDKDTHQDQTYAGHS
ncbi:hypothetical protein V5F63_00460 [Xanthobacter autotrophicus DSM 597]|uniref:hypothetical protein n=1 Tax=Xanthobacter wiegelii TaxID=3119913 RepID=UPI003728FBC6